MLKHLNETRRAHIVTIEDPIEYLFDAGKCMIIQRELRLRHGQLQGRSRRGDASGSRRHHARRGA